MIFKTIALALITFIILRKIFKKKNQEYHSHWNTMINDFSFSTKEFYDLITKEIQSKKIQGISVANVSLHQGNILSSKRLYLKITWNELEYNICSAPFSDANFFSSWLLINKTFFQVIISGIPFIGQWLYQKIYPVTFYKHDTTSMFMTFMHSALLKVIDEITKAEGIRSLSDTERKPIMQDIFKR